MKIKTGQADITLQTLVAIYSISMVTSLPGLAISPILGKLETIFRGASELELQLLESLPSFVIIPFILLAGRLSLKMNKKQLLIIGLAIFFACSVIYPLVGSLSLLLVVSGLLGIGAGLVIPFSTGLVADYFSGHYRTQQLGFVSAITNFTLVIVTLFAGFLAGINWHLSFLVYCVSGVSLLFAFFLKRREGEEGETANDELAIKQAQPAEKGCFHLPIGLMLFYYLITLAALAIPLNLSLYMQNLGIGNYATSGTLISVFFLAITLPGLFINRILCRLKEYSRFVSLILLSVGLLLFIVKAGIVWLTAGVVLIGVGYGVMQPLIYDRTVAGVSPTHATYALSLVMVMNYVAIITYPFILKVLGYIFSTTSDYFPFIFAWVIAVCLAVVSFFRRPANVAVGKCTMP
ncbi:MAG: MFS transporter [Odoribacter sp.]